jgi:acetyl-CoA acetyltransferase
MRRPAPATSSKIASLRPAFGKDGTVTAASSSSISDGAAALVLMSAAARAAADSSPSRACLPFEPRPGAGVVHHRPGRGDQKVLEQLS